MQVDVENFGGIGKFIKRCHTLFVKRNDGFQNWRIAHFHSACFKARSHQRGEAIIVGLFQVMLVDPIQFFGVELRGRRRDVIEIEPGAKLLHRKNFFVAVRPAEARQVIDHRLGQITVFIVLHHADRTVSLRELGAVVAKDHGQVRVLRHRRAKRLEYVDLAWGIVDMVVAAYDMCNAHVPVVHHHAEIVGGRTIAARDNEIIQFPIIELDVALHQVLPHYRTRDRIFKANYRRNSGWRKRKRFAGFGTPAAIVSRFFSA